MNFGGENGGQIQKFHLGWKVDRKTFLKITLGENLDTGKASKSLLQKPLRTGYMHRASSPVPHITSKFGAPNEERFTFLDSA